MKAPHFKLIAWLTCAALVACGKRSDAPRPLAIAPVASATAGLRGGAPCAGVTLPCGQFATPSDALRAVLVERPLVLAIGEAHAQKNAAVASSAKRAQTQLLPELKGQASDLLVELMSPPAGCQKATEGAREQQKVVTEKQAPTDQNEYVALGAAARRLGIAADLLRPSCDDLAAVSDAGADAIDVSLKLIKRLTLAKVIALRGRNDASASDHEKMVVTYGGALHNDVAPSAERAPWSFGPELSAALNGRYVELDVYVPELIDGSEKWQKMSWFAGCDVRKLGGAVTLFQTAPQSFVMVFAAGQ